MTQSVLLAEDEPLIALSFEDLLEAEGYQVVLAADGADALAKAAHMNENGVSPPPWSPTSTCHACEVRS